FARVVGSSGHRELAVPAAATGGAPVCSTSSSCPTTLTPLRRNRCVEQGAGDTIATLYYAQRRGGPTGAEARSVHSVGAACSRRCRSDLGRPDRALLPRDRRRHRPRPLDGLLDDG